MIIRRYKDEDYRGVTKVHVDTWKSTYKGIVPQDHLDNLTYESRYERNRSYMGNDDIYALVVEDDKENIIGFATSGKSREILTETYGELYGMYILKEFQGMGIGKKLVNMVKEYLQKQGFNGMVIWALEENGACGFYTAMGGEKLEEEKWLQYSGEKVKAVAFRWEF